MKTPIYQVLKSSNKSENFRLKGRKGWNCSREHIGLKGLDYAAMDYSILHNSIGIEGFLSKDSIVSMTPDFPHQSGKKFKAWENPRLSNSGGYPFIQASYRGKSYRDSDHMMVPNSTRPRAIEKEMFDGFRSVLIAERAVWVRGNVSVI